MHILHTNTHSWKIGEMLNTLYELSLISNFLQKASFQSKLQALCKRNSMKVCEDYYPPYQTTPIM